MRRTNVDTAAQVAMLKEAAWRVLELRRIERSGHPADMLWLAHNTAVNAMRRTLVTVLDYMTNEQFEATVNAMADTLEEETK